MQAVLRSLDMQRVQTAHKQSVDHFRAKTAESREFEQRIGTCACPSPRQDCTCVACTGDTPFTRNGIVHWNHTSQHARASRAICRQPGGVAAQAYGAGHGAGGERTAPRAAVLQ